MDAVTGQIMAYARTGVSGLTAPPTTMDPSPSAAIGPTSALSGL